MRFNQQLVLSILLVLIGLFFSFDLHHQLTLENLKSQQLAIETYRQAHPVLAIVAYAMLYIAVTGLSLPGATVLSLAGGGDVWLAAGFAHRFLCLQHRCNPGVSGRAVFAARLGQIPI